MKVLFFLALLLSVAHVRAQKTPKYEMRAVWIATVENIDWPSAPGLPAAKQQNELTELLDLALQYKMNTIVLQIRPAADAYYCSLFEPWSQWLTGTPGKAPEPFYDPLEFAIKECRKRGLDVHVWLNPYRAIKDTAMHFSDTVSIAGIHPEWMLTYGKTVYFDPALPETRNHVASVVSDIVQRYDIDAIHMDDYFYPYRIAGQNFPDDSSFTLYRGQYTENERDDWRRHNVDLIIQQLHDSIRNIKPWVQFGISPFGVWRNASKDSMGSATKAGQTNYDDLFADILKWQKEGWIDYVVPQLYWHIGMTVADYSVLASWWNNNTYGCNLYIGQAIYRLDRHSKVKSWRSADEIEDQVRLNRSLSHVAGSMFFSAKYMRTNPLRVKQHLKKVYNNSALPPSANRRMSIAPELPQQPFLHSDRDSIRLSWTSTGDFKYFVLYQFKRKQMPDFENPENIFLVTDAPFVNFKKTGKTTVRRFNYAVSSISHSNTESAPAFFSTEPD